ncbi:MAG: hypothetical protein ABEK16_01320 [Candidatus Nanohalobium sp.]
MGIEGKKHEAEVWAREIVRDINEQLSDSWIAELPASHGIFGEIFPYKVADSYADLPEEKRQNFERSLAEYVEEFEGADQGSIARDLVTGAINQHNYKNPYLAKKAAEGIAEGVMQ